MIKLILIVITALLLGGCTLASKQGDAAKDQSSNNVAIESPMPSLSSDTSDAALEADLEATIIQDEDFSDLE